MYPLKNRNMKSFIVKLNFPVFSLKLPMAFQVADTNLLPSPSSLRGALAKNLAYQYPFNSNDFQEAIEDWMLKIENIVPYVTVKPENEIVKGSIILSRHRTLEQRGRKDPRDAMRRGVVFTKCIKACYVVDEEKAKEVLGMDALEKIKESLWLIDRIGDTESLSSVSNVKGPLDMNLIGEEGKEIEINTIANESFAELLNQAYIDSMDTKFVYELTGKNKKIKKLRISRVHYLPVRAERINEFLVYKPLDYRIKAKKSKIYAVDNLKFVFGDINEA